MARVDLQCGCGYVFFVSDAQLKGGVKCPACLAPVKGPAGPAAAPKPAAPKAAPRAAAPATADAFAGAAADDAPSRKKLYIVGGAVAGGVVLLLVVLILVLAKPGVDPEKLAAQAELERKRKFEQISMPKGGKTLDAPPVLLPPTVAPAAPKPAEAKGPRSTEYKPMAAPAATSKTAPATPPAAAPPAAPATKQAGVAVSPDVMARLRSDLLSLHPYYLGMVLSPAEKARLEALSTSGRGPAEDADFAQVILTGVKLKAVRDEAALIVQTLPTLERESQENLPVDRITYLEGGRVLNCKILEEGTDVVKVSRALASGVGGQLPIRRDNIRSIDKGKGIGAEFSTRWTAAQKGTIASQVELLVWCKENNLAGQAKLVAYTIVRSDPSNTQARVEAGLPADPIKQAEEMAKGGFIQYQGRNWAAFELRDKFLKDGFVLLEGKWYSKKDKMIVVPGLFRYERQENKPVIFGGTAGAVHDLETVYKQVHDVASGEYTEQAETKFLRRFYAPEMRISLSASTPPGIVPPRSSADVTVRMDCDQGQPAAGTMMRGEVIIQVPVGAPILDASVITAAEVKSGGSIVVYHVTGSGDNEKRTKLYTCDPKENDSHPIPTELVRGMTDVNLIAVIEGPAAYTPKTERRRVRGAVYRGKNLISPALDIVHHKQIPDYKAVLFPSNSNTIEVFRLKATIADPSPALDKLFAANPEALK